MQFSFAMLHAYAAILAVIAVGMHAAATRYHWGKYRCQQ